MKHAVFAAVWGVFQDEYPDGYGVSGGLFYADYRESVGAVGDAWRSDGGVICHS